MRRLALALLLTTTPAIAQVQGPPLTLDAAIQMARRSSPSAAAASAGVDAVAAGRRVAGLRPNPTVAIDIVEAPKQTVSLAYPLELGGKRSARIGVADALGARTAVDRATVEAELRNALPEDRQASALWAYSARMGAMLYMTAGAGRTSQISNGAGDPNDVLACTDHLVAIALAGFRQA